MSGEGGPLAGPVAALIPGVFAVPGDVPLLRFGEAEGVGQALHDHWDKMSGAAPMSRDDMGWADLVQFVLRAAYATVAARTEGEH